MKIKLSRDTILGADKIGKAGDTVEVEKKQGRELVQMQRGVEVTAAEKAPATKTAAKKAAKTV